MEINNKKFDLGYILKVELTRFPDTLTMGHEKREHSIVTPNLGEDEVVINYDLGYSE